MNATASRARIVLTDLDRTLTGADLRLDAAALSRIRELRHAGVKVVVVTGRTLDHLVDMGLHRELDALVAENGAIVALPGELDPEMAGAGFADAARKALGELAGSFAWGRALGSGPREVAKEAKARLDAAGVPCELSFNAEEVMLLPAGVDKASGARRAMERLGVQAEDAWSIGDGENDVPLLSLARVSAVPANGSPEARKAATMALDAAYSEGFLAFTRPLVEQAPGAGPRPR